MFYLSGAVVTSLSSGSSLQSSWSLPVPNLSQFPWRMSCTISLIGLQMETKDNSKKSKKEKHAAHFPLWVRLWHFQNSVKFNLNNSNLCETGYPLYFSPHMLLLHYIVVWSTHWFLQFLKVVYLSIEILYCAPILDQSDLCMVATQEPLPNIEVIKIMIIIYQKKLEISSVFPDTGHSQAILHFTF